MVTGNSTHLPSVTARLIFSRDIRIAKICFYKGLLKWVMCLGIILHVNENNAILYIVLFGQIVYFQK